MRLRAVPLIAGVVLSLVAGGCAFFDYPEDDFDFGGVTTRYATGSATVTIGDERHVLDQVSPSSQLMSGFGAEVYWFNDEGWGLRLSGGTPGSLVPAMLAIDRVRTTYWSASDYSGRCSVKVDEADAKRLKGTATCTGLRWSDMLRGDVMSGGYVEGEAPFDATIEFEAAPAVPAA
jgi:hypothetical protein